MTSKLLVASTMPNTTPTTTPSANLKRERRKDARPTELLAAALDLFVEKGYAATRVEEVAKRAGVSKGTLFLYYASKEDLFKAVVRQNIAQRLTELSSTWQDFQGSSEEMLRLGLNLWWQRIGSTKASGITKLMISEENNFPELAAFYRNEVMVPVHQLLEKILVRGIERGEFRPIQVQNGIYMIVAPMLYLLIRKHSSITYAPNHAAIVPEDCIAAKIDTILYGLCQQAPAIAPLPLQPKKP